MTSARPFVDFTIFMGMHADEERVRVGCKNIFIEYARAGLRMSLDHIGMCDHIVWGNPYEVQEKYYPFMDMLHSTVPMERFYYPTSALTPDNKERSGIPDSVSYALLCNAVRRMKGALFTLLPVSLFSNITVLNPPSTALEGVFSHELESLYQNSRALVVPTELLTGVEQCKESFHLL